MALAAQEDLMKFDGPKILLVLTDGMDNRFVAGADKKDNPKNPSVGDSEFNKGSKGKDEEIPQFLEKTFKNSDITINMVLFNPPGDEGPRAHKQFDVIKDFKQPGKVYDATDVGQLRQRLRQSLIQQLWCKIKRGNMFVRSDEGLKIMTSDENPTWFPNHLDAGQYTSIIRGVPPQQIRLERGDFLYTTLNNDRLERKLVNKEWLSATRKQESGGKDWLLAVMQDQLRIDNSLQMLVTIEKQAGREGEGVLRQVKPKFAWVELKAQGAERPIGLRWQNPPRYPAYTVGLDVPEWPRTREGRRALPELHAWWTSEEPRVDGSVRLEDIKRATPSSPQRVKLGEESVTIENVRFAERYGKRCLVVRIRHAQGRPVFARLSGPYVEGDQEDQFYQQANTYTGIFWPVQESQTENLSLELFSLQKVLNDKATKHVTLDKLPEPDSGEDRDRYIQQAPERKSR